MTVSWRRSALSAGAPLGAGVGSRRGGGRSGRRIQRLDRRHDLAPVADDGDAEILEVVDGELRQHLAVDLVVAKRRLVLRKAEAVQPTPDVHSAPQTGPDQ